MKERSVLPLNLNCVTHTVFPVHEIRLFISSARPRFPFPCLSPKSCAQSRQKLCSQVPLRELFCQVVGYPTWLLSVPSRANVSSERQISTRCPNLSFTPALSRKCRPPPESTYFIGCILRTDGGHDIDTSSG